MRKSFNSSLRTVKNSKRHLSYSKKSMFGCCFSIVGMTILIVILLLFSGCKTVKKSAPKSKKSK